MLEAALTGMPVDLAAQPAAAIDSTSVTSSAAMIALREGLSMVCSHVEMGSEGWLRDSVLVKAGNCIGL